MARLLPFETDVSLGDRDPKVVDLNGDEADEVFAALSSGTSREVLSLLHEEPRTASALSEELDTTLQNVQYHLGKLTDAELIRVVDTWYSETGTEMKVYAPTDSALVLFAGEGSASTLRTALGRLLGGVGVLAVASLAINRLAKRYATSTPETMEGAGGDDAGGGDGAMTAADAEETATPRPTESATETPDAAAEPSALDGLLADPAALLGEPGAAFFLGGLLVLLLGVGWWYLQASRV